MPKLTQKRVKELFNYDQHTGRLVWKIRTSNRIKIGDTAGSKSKNGYLLVGVGGITYSAHRIIYLWMTGAFPEVETDHENHQRADNRWFNIKSVTHQSNGKNKSLSKRNTSGHIGISKSKERGKWEAYITVSRRKINLGRFNDITDAITVRREAEVKLGFHKNHGAAS